MDSWDNLERVILRLVKTTIDEFNELSSVVYFCKIVADLHGAVRDHKIHIFRVERELDARTEQLKVVIVAIESYLDGMAYDSPEIRSEKHSALRRTLSDVSASMRRNDEEEDGCDIPF